MAYGVPTQCRRKGQRPLIPESLYRYWGKAKRTESGERPYHLLAYHCLDVTALADAWWRLDAPLRKAMVRSCGTDEETLRALLLFFVALHDFGKWDVRFQLKVPEIARSLHPGFAQADPQTSPGYDHGQKGYAAFIREIKDCGDNAREWMRRIAGHHGSFSFSDEWRAPAASEATLKFDAETRKDWIGFLTGHFLRPVGVGLKEIPPPHPHGPRQWEVKDGRKRESFVSFRKTAPAWTQLSDFLMEHEKEKKTGWVPAPLVTQYRQVFPGKRLDLIVGGYRNKKAKILERRHERFSLTGGWDAGMDHVRDFLDQALAVKDALRNTSYGFGKDVGLPDLARLAEERFYSRSEESIHAVLRIADWKKVGAVRERLTGKLSRVAQEIFEELAAPYRHQPKALKRYISARQRLRSRLGELRRAA